MANLEHALEDCVTRLANGQARLEDCLALYPEHANELRRLFLAVSQLERGRTVKASSGFKARTRAQLKAHMAAHPRGRTVVGLASIPWVKFRLTFGVAVLVVLFLITGTALAQGALPGSAGYGWKIASERVWRVFQPDPLAADLVLTQRRADELAQVVGDSRAQAIALQGYRQALETLNRYNLPAAQPIIRDVLAEQKHSLDQVGLDVPELNELLPPATSGPAPPVSTPVLPTSTQAPPTSVAPAGTVAVPTVSTLVPLPESTLGLPASTIPPVIPTAAAVSSTMPGLPTISLPLPTLDDLLP